MNRFTLRLIAVCSSIMFPRRIHPVSAAIVIGLATSMLVASLANAQGPPQYLVTTMENDQGESFRPVDINNAGLAVLGKYSNPHLYVPGTEPGTGLMLDLANLVGATWIDLDTGEMWDEATPPSPWIADEARGINESNQIVGTAYDPTGLERVYVLEDPLGETPVFKLLPEFGGGVKGMAINDSGVVVGTVEGAVVVFHPPAYLSTVDIPAAVDFSGTSEPQEINNHGDIVTGGASGEGFIISPALHPDGSPALHPDGSFNYEQAAVHFFEGYAFYGINDSRQIAGTWPGTRGKNQLPNGIARFQYVPAATNADDRLVADPAIGGNDYWMDVNKWGDMALHNAVYLEGLNDPGPYGLDQLLVFASPNDEAKWMASTRAQSNGINDQGQIIVRGSGSLGFFLTPISVTPDPGITATPDNDLVTTEAGGSDVFTVQLNTAPGGPVTVGVRSLDLSEGIPDVSSLAFDDSNWDTPQEILVTGVQDSDVDGDQEYFVELAVIAAPAGSGYENLAPVLVRVTNEDDEVSSATLSVDGLTIVEGDKHDSTPGQFTVTLSGTPSGTVEVSYQVSNGSAKKNRDYRMIDPTSGDLVFAPGITSQSVAFEIIGDNANEVDENFTITLFDASGATITTAVGTVTILDDD